LRDYLADHGNNYHIGAIEVREGKMILRSHAE